MLMPLKTQHQLIRVGTIMSCDVGSARGTTGDMMRSCCLWELICRPRLSGTGATERPTDVALLDSGCHDVTPPGFLLEQIVAHSKDCKLRKDGDALSHS